MEKEIKKDREDLKPQEKDDVLLEDNDDKILVYMNTWANYNEYGADLVMYDNIDGWMTVDEAIEFVEAHEEDEPFINDTENVPFEVNEYDDAMTVLEQLKQLEDMSGYDKEMLERILSTNSFSFEEALNILEDGDYSFYPGATDEEQLGYAIIESIGSVRDAVSKDQLYYYVDEDMLRRDLSLDVREIYRDTAEEEVEYEHRFDDESEYDFDEEVEKWLDDHESDLLDQMVDETIDGELLSDDQLETYFDFEKFGRDCTYDGNCFFVDDGCLMLY